MEPVKTFSNYRIVINLRSIRAGTRESHRYHRKACFDLSRDIARHHGQVYCSNIEWDVRLNCPACGKLWEEDEDGYPLCCDAAQIDWEREHPEETSTTDL